MSKFDIFLAYWNKEIKVHIMSNDALEWNPSTGTWPSLPLPCTHSHAPPSPSPLSSMVYRNFLIFTYR